MEEVCQLLDECGPEKVPACLRLVYWEHGSMLHLALVLPCQHIDLLTCERMIAS